jgi:hypothetical protein
MADIPFNVTIYGFAFTDDISDISIFKEMSMNLEKRGAFLKDIVFSTWDDTDCTWVVAADRSLTDKEVEDTVDFIIDNNIEDIYLMIDIKKRQ